MSLSPLSSHPQRASATGHLSYAYGGPQLSGRIKTNPEDFYVTEQLGFTPSGAGEHIYLDIEKRCLTTLAVRDSIARLAGCKPMDVGYGGLKDKWACTRQWFSVYLPGRADIDWTALAQGVDSHSAASLIIHAVTRHNKKLRRGAHKANAFKLRVTELAANAGIASPDLSQYFGTRLQQLLDNGMPNYFGEQRYGSNKRSNNVDKARAMFANRQRMPREQRSLCLSAARSYLFNQLLSARVDDASWSRYIDGDVLMLEGSNSRFSLDAEVDTNADERATIAARLQAGDIHISGPLCGRGRSGLTAAAAQLEAQYLACEQGLIEGLEQQGVDHARRALRALPRQLEWQLEDAALELAFVLPTGSYATVLLRELVLAQ